ncbi:MAG: peptidoglycan bridge formation glycyltransferase FemA/FemB family protein [Bacilli bacterium]|nr:peptidoglycan bridge formation glycyltransferase FemA/FemB family protein [Bacilli bacterium]
MKFIENLDELEYKKFLNKCPYNHFLQSVSWGNTSEIARKQKKTIVGLKDDQGNLVAAGLLLKRVTPFNMCYFYSSRGFILDYNNKEVLAAFTKELKQFLKKENAIYLKIDPEIKYQTIDSEANKIDGENNYELFNNLIKLGYKHQGFNKLHEKNEPRYTFRRNLKAYHNMEEINESISKNFMKALKRSYNYDLEVSIADNLEDFIKLNEHNAKKDGFNGYPASFYRTFFEETKKEGNAKTFNISLNPKHLTEKFTKELDELNKAIENNTLNKKDKGNAKEAIARLEKDINTFKDLGDKDLVVCSMICGFTKNGYWTLYIGNDNIAEYTFSVNRVYYEAILDAFNNGFDFIDLFGTVGDPHTNYKNTKTLHEYKNRFGGEYVEFIGEFDLINKPFWYHMLPIILKVYRSFTKLLKKKR